MYHFRSTKRRYNEMNKEVAQTGQCPFCRHESGIDQAIFSNDHVFVIPNRVKYDIFEGRRVLEHYMIIPRRHVETLDALTDDERVAVMQIAGDYERRGFNVYARGVGSITRSVKHQHTHLIKVDNNPTKWYVFINKPYFLFHK